MMHYELWVSGERLFYWDFPTSRTLGTETPATPALLRSMFGSAFEGRGVVSLLKGGHFPACPKRLHAVAFDQPAHNGLKRAIGLRHPFL